MKVKLVPPPPDSLDIVAEARKAVPLVPGGEEDCCTRIMARLDIPGRDQARVWLTFLRGLGLVEETARGFVRTRTEVDLAPAFHEGIYGAAELVEILEAEPGPVSVETATERFSIPEWERHRRQDPETHWREQVRDRLDWLVLLGEARRTDEGYVRD